MIPFLDLKAQYAETAAAVQAAMERVFQRGQFILGPEVAAFEEEFAAYLGVPRAVGVASGTDALHLALRACGVGPGDEVITVSHTAVATVAAIELAGARPVFVDILPASYTLAPAQVEARITARTRAILPVHLYGQAADLAPLLELAKARGLRVIEDACQAHGAEYRGRKAGAWGDIGCFSFYPTKNLGAYGDGGMAVIGDPELARRLRLLRTYGWAERDRSVLRGVNSRLDELQAAVLRAKLPHLDAWNARRRSLAAHYTALLEGIPNLQLPQELPSGKHVYHLYVVRTPERDGLRRHLADRGIGALAHYPTPVHLQQPYQDLGFPPGSLPESEAAAREVLSLPLYPQLPESAVGAVAAAVRQFFGVPAAAATRAPAAPP
ncbi:MAG: DegT/DnrJ/EryC1/StrS family aminotransferase [Chloroflexi bacterium]|nr:DegT/DnrJ/EryC1/StrS family aminotransferase [Chloroflexota bacterium]